MKFEFLRQRFFSSVLVFSAILTAFALSTNGYAGILNPPRNIRVIPGSITPCTQSVLEEATQAIQHLMADYQLSESEAMFVYSTVIAGRSEFSTIDENARMASYIGLNSKLMALVSKKDLSKLNLEDQTAKLTSELGLPEDAAQGLVLIRLVSKDLDKAEFLNLCLNEYDSYVFKLQASVRGCQE